MSYSSSKKKQTMERQMFTFEVYAGKNFLGYEYGADVQEAHDKTYRKFGEPWQYADCDRYVIKMIENPPLTTKAA